MGILFANLQLENRLQEIIDEDSSKLQSISGFIGEEVSGSLSDLRSLSSEGVTMQALDSGDRMSLRSLQSSFLTLARRNPNYQQVRWIDKSGIERIRVVRDQGEPYLVEQQDLQDKIERYYFKEANALLKGEMYISRVDLNVEHGQIEIPPNPVLRVATPVYDSAHNRQGIIIINIAMGYLFNLVQNSAADESTTNYLLLNQQGELLNGWNEEINSAEPVDQGANFVGSNPAVWRKITLIDAGSQEMQDGLWTWKTLSPIETFNRLAMGNSVNSTAFASLIKNDFSLTLAAHRPMSYLLDMRQKSRFMSSLSILIGITVFGFSLFFYLSGHVRARRAELNAAYALAQASNMERLKELEKRFRNLVEASSIGQMVIDDAGKIELSNAAADNILGYEKGELEGLSVDVLLPKHLQNQHVHLREQYMQNPEARRMGVGRELMGVTKAGVKIPLEVGLNPYTDQGRQVVLVSIINLTAQSKA